MDRLVQTTTIDDIEMEHFNLLGLSDGILYKVFKQLNDTDLLAVTKVCKRFGVIAKDAFAIKYSGESSATYYNITVLTNDAIEEPKLHWPIFNTFGDKLSALNVDFKSPSKIVQKHWLIRTINEKCSALVKLGITRNVETNFISLKGFCPIFSTLTHLTLNDLTMKSSEWAREAYPLLKNFKLERVKGFDQSDFDQFIAKNPQLETLYVIRCDGFHLDVLQRLSRNKMSELKTLELDTGDGVIEDEVIRLENLESLAIAVGHQTIINVLKAVAKGCKELHSLKIDPVRFDYKLNIGRGDVIDVICSFERLKQLDILGEKLHIDLIIVLVSRLPVLQSLRIHKANNHFQLSGDNVLSLFSLASNLIEFTLHIHSFEKNKKLSFHLDFFERFVAIVEDRDAKFTIEQEGEKIVINKDVIKRIDAKEIQRALEHGTWKMARNNEIISEKVFSFDMDNLLEADNALRHYGKNIRRLSISWRSFSDENVKKEFWNRVMATCGQTLVDLHIQFQRYRLESMKPYNLSFPNVTKLVLETFSCTDITNFEMFDCPKLTHLELYEYRFRSQENVTREQIAQAKIFKNLESIKLDTIDEKMRQVFHLMDDAACARIEEFTFGSYQDEDESDLVVRMMLVNVISRFHNLKALNIIIPYIERVNVKHLFENCTKIVKLSLAFEAGYDFEKVKEMFECVQKNCKEIQHIQLVQRAFSEVDGNEFDDEEEYHEDFLKMVFDLFPGAAIDVVAIGYDCESLWVKRVVDSWKKMTKRPL